MSTVIYFYTGTGNSLYTAKKLAELTGGAELIPMAGSHLIKKAEAVGLVFPVHMWGVPGAVLNFLKRLENIPGTYYFAAAVNAGEVSRTLIQLKEEMAKKGMQLSAGFDIVMPSNYVPWGGPGSDEDIRKIYEKAESRISDAAAYIKERKSGRLDKGPLWQRIIYTQIYKSAVRWVNYMDKNFWVDDKCNSCGICEKVCPARNITLEGGKPVWHKKCEQCLACIQWCPEKSIQYGKKTPLYPRYHHKDIKVSEIINISK